MYPLSSLFNLMGNYLLQLLVNIEKRHPPSMIFILGIVLVKACVFTFQKASHMYHDESKLLAITATAASEYNCAVITTTDDDVMNKSLLHRGSVRCYADKVVTILSSSSSYLYHSWILSSSYISQPIIDFIIIIIISIRINE
jgi:hypothetical protein